MEKNKEEPEFKTIRMKNATHKRLLDFAKKSETFDDAIERLFDMAENGKKK